MNPSIGEPPESGMFQFTITLSGDQVVETVVGWSGICAARMETVLENVLNPYTFLASTLNW